MLGIVELCGVVGLARVVGALLRGMDVAVPAQVAMVREPTEHLIGVGLGVRVGAKIRVRVKVRVSGQGQG